MADWSRVKAIFQELIELPDAQRREALESRYGDDAALRSAVEGLLDAHDRADSFMGTPPVPRMDSGFPAVSVNDGPAGAVQVDGLQLLDVIGEGGYGTVYRTQQELPVRRIVALKVIKAGMDTRDVIRRFEAERQTLALMNHPNVAAVLDAGATATGRPYFVMEYVDGRCITEYCDAKRVSLIGRLHLLMQVCDAIQHAHQKGIIHRDIKPGNVLVVEDDAGLPRVKVIDFGIAKAMDNRTDQSVAMTVRGMLIGTPEYMSPEQADPGHTDIDTRTDIYSLGVLLYELLTGTLPFSARTLRSKGMAEIQRIVREETPPRPSRRLTVMARDTAQRQTASRATAFSEGAYVSARDDWSLEMLQAVAENRDTDVRTLRRSVQGELDWIVMKCLEKDRARRYESTNEIAAEIRRFIRHEPVLAGPPGTGYQIAKFVRRNRTPVLAAAVAVLGLVVGLVLALVGMQRATVARNDADGQRDVARLRAEEAQVAARKAEAINAFLQGMLASADPRVSAEKDMTVRAALELALAKLAAGELRDEPVIEAEVRLTIGRSLAGLAEYDAAIEQANAAGAIFLKQGGDDSEALARAWHERGTAHKLAGRAVDAEADMRLALAIFKKQTTTDELMIAACRNDLALTLIDQQRFDEAEPLLRDVYAFANGPVGSGTQLRPEAVNNLGSLHMARGEFVDAETYFREAIDINEARHGAQHPNLATNLDNLAQALQGQKKFDEALQVFDRALGMRRALFGKDHPDVATTLHNVAVLHYLRGSLPDCEAALRESLGIFKKIYGMSHSDTLTVNDSLVSVAGALGQLDEAETLLSAALAAIERDETVPNERKFAVAMRLAQLKAAQGKSDAEAEWKQVAAKYAPIPTTGPTAGDVAE